MKYFNGKVSGAFMHLYSGRLIIRLAGSLMGLFLPIYMYQLFGNNIEYVFLYYLIAAILYGFLVPWTTKFLNTIGLRRSLHISIFFGSFYYVFFYLIDKLGLSWEFSFSNPAFCLAGITIIVLTIDRLMHWVPFHTDLAKFTNKKNRGKELSLMEATSVGLGAAMPIIAGWVLYRFSYDLLFVVVMLVYLSSLIFFMRIPRTRERYSWTYREAWKNFFDKSRRKTIYAFMADGAEGCVGGLVWPIFMFELLNGNYFDIGALSSIIVVVTVVLQLMTGKYVDSDKKKGILKYGTIFYSIGWVVKIFIASAFQIFVVSTYHSLARVFSRTTYDTIYYEKAADQGHYVDEFTVLHEMALQMGKIVIYPILIVLVMYFDIKWAFILGALASIFMNFLLHDDEVHIMKNRVVIAKGK